ncbi:MAG: AAA family ATPase [Promethearchaeota archaeon]
MEHIHGIPLSRIFSVKHEPRTLGSIAGHERERDRLQKIITSGKVSHILIAGPDGCGKLTLAKAFARDLLGDDITAGLGVVHVSNPLTSEERKDADRKSRVSSKRIGSMAGLKFTWPKFIQLKVKPFVELHAMNSRGYKILIVTDFHLLGNDQQGFRRLMEMYGPNCRFILITSQISSVIDPIISRCQVLLVSPVSKARFYKAIKDIGNDEDYKVNYTFINSLYYVTKGNIGKALNYIQIMKIKKVELTANNLFKILKVMDGTSLLKFIESGLNGKYIQARDVYYQLKKIHGFKFVNFLEMIRKATLMAPLSQFYKATIIDIIGTVDSEATHLSSEVPHLFQLLYMMGGVART